MASRFTALLDACLPAQARRDTSLAPRYRAATGTLFSISSAMAAFVPVYLLCTSARPLPEATVMLLMALLPLAGVALVRVSGSMLGGLLLANVGGVGGIAAVAWHTGGIASFAVSWLLAIIAMVGSYGNRAALALTLALTIVAVLLLYVAGTQGAIPPFAIASGEMQRLQALFILSALLLVVWSVMLAVRARQRSSARMRRAIADADTARAEAEYANRAKTEFLRMISHELRTPMNGILGGTQLLQLSTLSKEDGEQLGHIDASARRLLQMIDTLLDFTRLNAGEVELRVERFDLRQLLDSVGTLLRPAAERKELGFAISMDTQATHYQGDAGALRTVLLNLLGNAVRFTVHGGIRLDVYEQAARDGTLLLRADIHDTGPGIAASDLPHLFTTFRQLDGSLTRRNEGAGLGLAICKRLVDLLGGRIGVDSRPGTGSTFWFEVPVSADAAPIAPVPDTAPATPRAPASPAPGLEDLSPVVAPAAPVPARPATHRGRHVLLVEDNLVNQRVAATILARLGYTVDVAGNGEEALAALAQADYACVLMDIQMPVMDGMEATQRIRGGNERLRDMPVIALTANVLSDQRERYTECGMNGFVAKPIAIELLAQELERVLGATDSAPGRPDAGP